MLKFLNDYIPLIAVICVYLVGALTLINKKSFDPVGPAGFSLAMITLLVILTATSIIKSIKNKEYKVKTVVNKRGLAEGLTVCALSVLYVFLMSTVGYLLLTPFYVAGLLCVLGNKNWKKIVILSLTVTVILYLPFRYIFNVPLPRGFLWFL